jgi:hypothetical protein
MRCVSFADWIGLRIPGDAQVLDQGTNVVKHVWLTDINMKLKRFHLYSGIDKLGVEK